MIDEIRKLMQIIETQRSMIANLVECQKITSSQVARLQSELDELKVLVNANNIVRGL